VKDDETTTRAPVPPEAAQRPIPPFPPERNVTSFPPFADWLQDELQRREWRQADFARVAGVDVSMVSRWLRGRRPDPTSLERVAAALGVEIDALLTLAGHRPSSPRDDDPRVAALVAKIRQITWTPERFLIVDALLDDLRHRSTRVPVEQVPLPGMDEGDEVLG
jgi:transcriptional regulator with XRE-family HTH domain